MEMTYWNAIKDSRNPSDFKAYVNKFPNGLFVEIANGRIATLENEAREKEKAKSAAEEAERAANSHLFDVKDAGGTEGTLTVTPGAISFEPRKQNEKKKIMVQCSEIKRVEQGQSAFVQPHVNLLLGPGESGGKQLKERELLFYTSTPPSGGIFTPAKPGTNITTEVINSIIQACRMARINK
jgi:hypothetical protein